MRIRKAIQHSSLAEPKTVRLTVPESYTELSDKQLEYLYELLSLFPLDEAKAYFLLRCSQVDGNEDVSRLPSELMAVAMSHLDWVGEPPECPVRLASMNGCKAIDSELHGCTFQKYITIENLYQGYLLTQDSSAVDSLASVLYPGFSGNTTASQAYNVIAWITAVKQLFAAKWPFFFRSSGPSEHIPSMEDIMNSEIRALTGGDITKESVVLNSDCWRALTELNEKAKEAKEMERIANQHK